MNICKKADNQKTKVLFVSYNGLLEPLLYSQAIIYLRKLTSELNVKIVVLSFEKLGFFLNSEKRKKINAFKKELLHDNIKWYWLRYHKFPRILSSFYDIFIGIQIGCFLILKERIAFIHARSYVPAVIAFILSKLFNMKYMFDMRGFMIEDYVDLGAISKEGLIRHFAKWTEKVILKSSSYIVVLTQEARKALIDYGYINNSISNNIEIIPCCVDLSRFHNCINKDPLLLKSLELEDKCVFVYAGSLGKLYQLDKMLDFFKVAYNSISNAHFLIITPDINEVLTEGLKYKDGRLFENISYFKVDPEEIGRYISLGDVGIAFYLPSPFRIATSPTKIGEYLACGLPFVVNAGVGDTEKWINQYKIGAVVKNFSTGGYKEAVNMLLALIRDKDALAERCRQAARELLSLKIARERYGKIYRSLLAKGVPS